MGSKRGGGVLCHARPFCLNGFAAGAPQWPCPFQHRAGQRKEALVFRFMDSRVMRKPICVIQTRNSAVILWVGVGAINQSSRNLAAKAPGRHATGSTWLMKQSGTALFFAYFLIFTMIRPVILAAAKIALRLLDTRNEHGYLTFALSTPPCRVLTSRLQIRPAFREALPIPRKAVPRLRQPQKGSKRHDFPSPA
jgi:hypothetical protein